VTITNITTTARIVNVTYIKPPGPVDYYRFIL